MQKQLRYRGIVEDALAIFEDCSSSYCRIGRVKPALSHILRCEKTADPIFPASRALGAREKFEHVTVRIAEIDAAAALARIQPPILHAPGITAPGNAHLLHALKDSVELLVAHVERIVMLFKRIRIIEVQGKVPVYLNRSKVARRPVIFKPEDLREEPGRCFLVTRRHDRVIQSYRHDRLPIPFASADADA